MSYAARLLALCLSLALLSACGDTVAPGPTEDTEGGADRQGTADVATSDSHSPVPTDTDDAFSSEPDATTGEGHASDINAGPEETDASPDAMDTSPTAEPVPQLRAYASAPAISLLPENIESCSIIAETRCDEGVLSRCALYDANVDTWAIEVPPMTEQAFWFERYYDLYHRANGLSMDIEFSDHMLPGTPESEWSKPEAFRRYDGRGDSSGWTGTALWGAAARYAVTGTEADYERMLSQTEAMAFLYEVTNVPGMMARSHYGMLEEGAPEANGHWNKSLFNYHISDGTDGHFALPIDESLLSRVPAYYTEGVEIDGVMYDTSPTVQYDTSRDQYVRGLPGLMLAYDMLGEGEREEAIRATLLAELPCTLNRMKKGRISNLQSATDILDAVTAYFGGSNVILDADDMDLGALDVLTFYVLEQPHPDHLDAFDASCPPGPPMEVAAELDLDASDPLFLFDFAQLAMREQRGGPVPIAFSMHISVRAGDVIFMTQWALTAHALTGDDAYLDFVSGMMTETDYWGALNLYGAFQLPKWCMSHYGPSLGYPSLYNLLARIDRTEHPTYWDAMARVAFSESRLKENGPREDAFFGILYNRMVDDLIDSTASVYVADSVALLSTYGMDPTNKLEPDRSYPRNFVDAPQDDVPLEEIAPGDPEWAICEEPSSIMGLEVPAAKIDGVPIRSVDPLPLDKRIGGTFLWQMDPWMVKREYGGIGMETQWPGAGMFTAYWVGRMDNVIQEGAGLALGWQTTDEACTP